MPNSQLKMMNDQRFEVIKYLVHIELLLEKFVQETDYKKAMELWLQFEKTLKENNVSISEIKQQLPADKISIVDESVKKYEDLQLTVVQEVLNGLVTEMMSRAGEVQNLEHKEIIKEAVASIQKVETVAHIAEMANTMYQAQFAAPLVVPQMGFKPAEPSPVETISAMPVPTPNAVTLPEKKVEDIVVKPRPVIESTQHHAFENFVKLSAFMMFGQRLQLHLNNPMFVEDARSVVGPMVLSLPPEMIIKTFSEPRSSLIANSFFGNVRESAAVLHFLMDARNFGAERRVFLSFRGI